MLMTLVHTSNSLLYTYTHVKSIRQEEYEERAQKKNTQRTAEQTIAVCFYTSTPKSKWMILSSLSFFFIKLFCNVFLRFSVIVVAVFFLFTQT